MKFVYINGKYLAKSEALLSVDDRGLVFGDALYESITVHEAAFLDLTAHLDRLYDCMASLEILPRLERQSILIPILELYRREKLRNGYLYIQVSRGIAPRMHAFPPKGTRGSLFMYFLPKKTLIPDRSIKLALRDDPRSTYCFYKATSLLPNILAKQEAIKAGFDEVLFTRGDRLIEGASCNFFMLYQDKLYTCPADRELVPGVTRNRVIEVAKKLGIEVVYEAPTKQMIPTAQEAFISHASNAITRVTHIDAVAIGNTNQVTKQLFEIYNETVPRYSLAI